VSLYGQDSNSAVATGLIRSKPVFLLTSLGEAEFTNAVQLRVFRKEWTRLEARSVHDLFLQHQAAGVFRIAPLGSEIWEKALVLSAAATWRRSGARRLLYVRQTAAQTCQDAAAEDSSTLSAASLAASTWLPSTAGPTILAAMNRLRIFSITLTARQVRDPVALQLTCCQIISVQ